MKKLYDLYLAAVCAFLVRAKELSVGALMLLLSFEASAKVSDWTNTGKGEIAAIVPVVLLGIMAIAVCVGTYAVISGIQAKKNNEPLKWQHWGVIGAAFCLVVPGFLLATSGSIGGNESASGATLNELGIQY